MIRHPYQQRVMYPGVYSWLKLINIECFLDNYFCFI
ncbi:protein of unknown function [Rhodovastum atsumiense]|nr:protein of unknown function [Rhodovastum atsumiense]